MLFYLYFDLEKRINLKKRIKKKIKYSAVIILIIVLIFSSPLILKGIEKKKNGLDIPTFKEEKDNIEKNLSKLNYSKEDISFIKKELNTDNINYLIEKQIDNKQAMDIIKETYYIDSYLDRYITFHANNPTLNTKEVVTRINTHLDNPFYTSTMKTDTTLGKFVILNKYYHADETYQGENLIKIDKEYNLYGNDFYLSKECYESFINWYKDAKKAGNGFKINGDY